MCFYLYTEINYFIIQLRIKLVFVQILRKTNSLKYSSLILNSFRFNYQKYNLTVMYFKANNKFTVFARCFNTIDPCLD